MLYHQRQQGDTCMYMAVHALTGDEAWLTYARDEPDTCQEDLPFMQRLAEAGALLFSLYSSRRDAGRPITRRYWRTIRQQYAELNPGGTVPMLVVAGEGHLYHCVAAELDLHYPVVRISDSNHDKIQTFTWAGFLQSAYARAYRVELLVPLQ